MHKSFAAVNKQTQDIYVQMRKLSSDVFDQIKNIKNAADPTYLLEKERANLRDALIEAKNDMDKNINDLRY